MARQTTVRLTDDLDGSDAQATVRFAWEGVEYEIDLTSEHADAFTSAVRPYLDAARRVGPARRGRRSAMSGRGARTGRGARPGRSVGEQAVIRDWARSNGFQLAGRGRIPRRVLDAYQAGQRQGAPLTGAEPAPTASKKTPAAQARKSTSKTRAAAKAAPAAKASAKKSTVKKATAKETSARESAAKKATAKKTTAKKTTAKKTTAEKTTAGKAVAKKAKRRARAAVKAS